jgi:hypothetical protein
MNYAKIQEAQLLQYPYGLGELSSERPGSVTANQNDLVACFNSTDLPAAGFSLVAVDEKPIPSFDPITQWCNLSDTPVLESGSWVLPWVVSAKSEEQMADELVSEKGNLRARRNEKLQMSDWTQLGDSPVNKEAWATYRQALRDVTGQKGFPWTIIWPTQPE